MVERSSFTEDPLCAFSGMYDEVGQSKLMLWDNPEGWVLREVGGVSGMGDTCTPLVDSC